LTASNTVYVTVAAHAVTLTATDTVYVTVAAHAVTLTATDTENAARTPGFTVHAGVGLDSLPSRR